MGKSHTFTPRPCQASADGQIRRPDQPVRPAPAVGSSAGITAGQVLSQNSAAPPRAPRAPLVRPVLAPAPAPCAPEPLPYVPLPLPRPPLAAAPPARCAPGRPALAPGPLRANPGRTARRAPAPPA